MHTRSRTLTVDDEPFNVDFLEQELEDLGYDTASAEDGQEALAKVTVAAPDLVLLDIMMPIMDGFEVLSCLKADTATRDIPVIIISAMDGTGSVVRGIEMGAGVQIRLTRSGPVVGVVPNVPFCVCETQMAPGDTLLIFSDGVIDAQDERGEFLSQEKLLSLLARPPQMAAALLDTMAAQLERHMVGANQFDDITVLAMRRKPAT